MSKTNGGPAFPSNYQHVDVKEKITYSQRWGGMTLRDYFAAKALQGILTSETNDECYTPLFRDNKMIKTREAVIAGYAYCYADAMLKERESLRRSEGDEHRV